MINVIEIGLRGVAVGVQAAPGGLWRAPSNSERKLFINAAHIRGDVAKLARRRRKIDFQVFIFEKKNYSDLLGVCLDKPI